MWVPKVTTVVKRCSSLTLSQCTTERHHSFHLHFISHSGVFFTDGLVVFTMGKYTNHRMLNRSSPHRQALLRNLVTSLFLHESISTTWPKAKEAQKLAEKCITLAKKGTDTAKLRAGAIFYVCEKFSSSSLIRSSDLMQWNTSTFRIPMKFFQNSSATSPKDIETGLEVTPVFSG